MKKFIAIIILFCTCIFLFVFGWYTVSIGKPNDTFGMMQKIIPYEIREILKKTIFIIPDLKRTVKRQENIIEEQKLRYLNLVENIVNNNNQYYISYSKSKKIISKFNNYSYKDYPLPFPNRSNWGFKPIAYIDDINDKILLVSGNGVFFSIEKTDLNSDDIFFYNIDTNIKKIIKDPRFHNPSKVSIRDLLIVNNLVFISYIKEQSKGCYNTSILVSKFNLEFMNFSEFFSYEQCQYETKPDISVDHSGGRMVQYNNNKILLTIGEFHNSPLAQDNNYLFGKIISIDLGTNDYEIISKGHRNSQGLYYDKKNNIIIFTEHGPQGGDEININSYLDNNIIENYGWPISSYGVHYDGKFREEAPLHKSHKQYGFIEPIKYYVPSIAISEIVKIPKEFNNNFNNDFFVSSLGYKDQILEGDMSLHHIRFNEEFDEIIFEEIIPIGERIRDILIINKTNNILLILENTPALAVLKKDN